MTGRTVSPEQTVIFHDVQHSTHLTKYQDARPFDPYGGQQSVQDNHFSAILDEMFVSGIRRTRFLVDPSVPALE